MFQPDRVVFEVEALQYPLGQQLYQRFLTNSKIELYEVAGNRINMHIPGDGLYEKYRAGKKTLVVGVKKSLKFQTCKPSAHYQIPIVSGCMGQCEYCYLNTQLGDRPFVRVHVNIEEILDQTMKYTKEREPKITIFEGSATSDPVPVETYTNALAKCITFFGNHELTRFRFASKYTDVESLLNLEHNGHTEIRFSINTERVIREYEHHTPKAIHRIEAAAKVASSGYPVGFLVAPVFMYENWKEEYSELIDHLKERLPLNLNSLLTFEVISHRYTLRAKERILEVFPETTLPMLEENRVYQYGQFGYGKYKYSKEELRDMEFFFTEEIKRKIPESRILYII